MRYPSHYGKTDSRDSEERPQCSPTVQNERTNGSDLTY